MARPFNRYNLARAAGLGMAACWVIVFRADAQEPGTCEGLPVASVTVETDRPEFRGPMAWWRAFARELGLHHHTTSEGLVRRFVTLEPGRTCTEFRRTESERILRAQPYLADARVTTRRVGDSVHVTVYTVDEVSIVAGARLRGASLQAASLGTLNFEGAGLHLEGRWEQGRALRDGFGMRASHQQVLGHPYTVLLDGQRHPLGEYLTTEVSHPFITDLQRIAWHAGYTVSKDFAPLRRPDRTQLLQPVDRAMWDIGGVLRFGPPRRLGLIGGMVLYERQVIRNEFTVMDADGAVHPATDTSGVRAYETFDATNIAGVLGLRALTFTRMAGLDALAAEQDVATGTQIGTMLGMRPIFQRDALRNAFGVLDVYVGGRSRRNFAAARVEAESRLDLDRPDWRHLVASGRAAWYFKPRPAWVSEVTVEGAGAWRTVLPFQLELGDRRGGVRGYVLSHEPGAQRLLARLEQRWDVGRYQGTRGAYGFAAFTDAGKIWAGDVPFGTTSPVRVSAGFALLAAVPAASRRTLRLEAAFPLDRRMGARPEVRFTVSEPARGFWFEPPRIRWARLAAVPEQIFSWP